MPRAAGSTRRDRAHNAARAKRSGERSPGCAIAMREYERRDVAARACRIGGKDRGRTRCRLHASAPQSRAGLPLLARAGATALTRRRAVAGEAQRSVSSRRRPKHVARRIRHRVRSKFETCRRPRLCKGTVQPAPRCEGPVSSAHAGTGSAGRRCRVHRRVQRLSVPQPAHEHADRRSEPSVSSGGS
jgi:hypothetical protein